MWIAIIILIVFGLICEFAGFMATGKWLSEDFLNRYFTEERLQKYKENGCRGNLIYGLGSQPFISTVPLGISAKWYIQGIGQIPRWSKWHKRINQLHEDILLT